MRHLLLAMFLSVALIGCSDEGTPEKQSAADISAGKVVADKECKGCHGLDGKGAAPGIPNLAGQRGRYIMAALKEYKEGMRVHAALRAIATDYERRRDARRRRVLRQPAADPGGERAPSSLLTRTARRWRRPARRCHGADGNSKTAGTPNLAGQQPIYFVAATQEYLTGARESAPMDPMLRKLSKLDIESVALYFASQTPAQRSAPPTGNAAAGEPRTAVCGGCHGSHGVSTDTATPSLAGQDPQYLAQAIKAYRTTRKHDTDGAPGRRSQRSGHRQHRRVLYDAEVEARGRRADICSRTSPTSAIVATPATSTIRRWRSRSSTRRTRTIWFWRCGPIATASAEIR